MKLIIKYFLKEKNYRLYCHIIKWVGYVNYQFVNQTNNKDFQSLPPTLHFFLLLNSLFKKTKEKVSSSSLLVIYCSMTILGFVFVISVGFNAAARSVFIYFFYLTSNPSNNSLILRLGVYIFVRLKFFFFLFFFNFF